MAASAKVEGFFSNEELTVEENEHVQIQFIRQSELGYTVIVNNKHLGLVYENEIFSKVYLGDVREGFVKKIREDNKIDVSLQPIGYRKFSETNSELIVQRLMEREGFLPLTDKSTPEEIYSQLGIRKRLLKNPLERSTN